MRAWARPPQSAAAARAAAAAGQHLLQDPMSASAPQTCMATPSAYAIDAETTLRQGTLVYRPTLGTASIPCTADAWGKNRMLVMLAGVLLMYIHGMQGRIMSIKVGNRV